MLVKMAGQGEEGKKKGDLSKKKKGEAVWLSSSVLNEGVPGETGE